MFTSFFLIILNESYSRKKETTKYSYACMYKYYKNKQLCFKMWPADLALFVCLDILP